MAPRTLNQGLESPRRAVDSHDDISRTLSIVSAMVAEDDPMWLAAKVIEEAAAVMHADGGSIFLPGPVEPNHPDGFIALDIVWSRDDGARTGRRLALGEGVAGWVAKHGEALLLNDARKDSRFSEFGGRTSIGSLIAVPLDISTAPGDFVRGVLTVHSAQLNAFTMENLTCLMHFGSLACLIFRRVREKEALEELNRSLCTSDERLIREISYVHLAMTMSRNVLAKQGFENQTASVCHEIREQFELSGVAVFLVNSLGTRLQGVASDGFSGSNIAAMDYALCSGEDGAVSNYLVRSVRDGNMEQFRVVDSSDADWSDPGQYACIPLRVNGKTFGAIVLSMCAPDGSLTDETLVILETFADLVSLAILQARTTGESREAYLEILSTLANVVELRDTYTGMHTENVMAYSVALGRASGLSEKEIEDIRLGAILHDIGKIAIVDRVLQKPGTLLPWEYDEMKLHVEHGSEIITTAHLLKGAYNVVRHHHERWDGAGYPDRLMENNIPVPAQIVAIADAYDAMVTDRPYRKGMTSADAVLELRRNAGTQFSPYLVEIFVRTLGFEQDEDCAVISSEELNTLWLALDGTLTLHAGRLLLAPSVEWITPSRRRIVVNLSRTRQVVEAGLWSLLRISSKCRAVEGFLIIIAQGEIKRRILSSAQGLPFRVMEDEIHARNLLQSYQSTEQSG